MGLFTIVLGRSRDRKYGTCDSRTTTTISNCSRQLWRRMYLKRLNSMTILDGGPRPRGALRRDTAARYPRFESLVSAPGRRFLIKPSLLYVIETSLFAPRGHMA